MIDAVCLIMVSVYLQERVLPKILQRVGYATNHFGKWHLNGYQGPGVRFWVRMTNILVTMGLLNGYRFPTFSIEIQL